MVTQTWKCNQCGEDSCTLVSLVMRDNCSGPHSCPYSFPARWHRDTDTADNQEVVPAESDAAAREVDGERVDIVGPEQQADIIASQRVREEEAESNSHKSPI